MHYFAHSYSWLILLASTFSSSVVLGQTDPLTYSSPDLQLTEGLVITLNRTTCLGMCPDYTVVVHGNGVVGYEGREWVDVKGSHRASVAIDSVRSLVSYFWEQDLFEEEERQLIPVDASVTTITFQLGDLNRTVVTADDDGKFYLIAERIDQIAGTEQWTGVEALERRIDSLRTVRPDVFKR